jgi:ArsR family transcriptional regulator, arsenate/arsenite/antimonite-responsive transcriptional repressor
MDQMSMSLDGAMRLLDGVRDPNRLEIIFLLGKGTPMNVGEIAERFKISRPAISHHLKVLKDAGILRSEKSGQEVYYHLNRDVIVAGLRSIADAIESCCLPGREQKP